MNEEKVECWTIKEYVLYKMDRSMAIVGLIVLGVWALAKGTPEMSQIAIAVVGVLGGYIGGRSGKA